MIVATIHEVSSDQIENFVDRHQDMLNHREHNVFLENVPVAVWLVI